MATVNNSPTTEFVEAVIISGPKKGAIVQVRDDNHVLSDDYVLTPDEERAFDELQAQAERTLEAVRETVASARALHEELAQITKGLPHGTV